MLGLILFNSNLWTQLQGFTEILAKNSKLRNLQASGLPGTKRPWTCVALEEILRQAVVISEGRNSAKKTCLNSWNKLPVEDDVNSPGHDAPVGGCALHGMRFARPGDTIGEKQTVLVLQEVFDQRHRHPLEHVRVGSVAVEHLFEGVLRLSAGVVSS